MHKVRDLAIPPPPLVDELPPSHHLELSQAAPIANHLEQVPAAMPRVFQRLRVEVGNGTVHGKVCAVDAWAAETKGHRADGVKVPCDLAEDFKGKGLQGWFAWSALAAWIVFWHVSLNGTAACLHIIR